MPRKLAILPKGIAIAAENADSPPICDPYHSEHAQLSHFITRTTPGSASLIDLSEILVGYYPL